MIFMGKSMVFRLRNPLNQWAMEGWLGGQALVMDWHPDRAKDPELSTKVFQWLQAIETAAESAVGVARGYS
jgi:uncharacterized protein (DUF2235 family)